MALLLYRSMNSLKLEKLNRNYRFICSNSWLMIQSDIVSTFLPSSKILKRTTSSWKAQIKCLFILLEFWLQKKTQKWQSANPAWNTDTALGGSIWGHMKSEALRWVPGTVRNQPPYSDTPSRLMLPVDCRMVLMIPACCVQQDRFPTCEHGIPSRLPDCYHPSGRESKTSTKRSARNSPPSLGMRDCLLRSFRFQNGRFIGSF